ncbi:MAG: CRTAC1 family protein [Myxococcota bacterium]|nr:CRTAC1 family protein [Myxococcota bacterium]
MLLLGSGCSGTHPTESGEPHTGTPENSLNLVFGEVQTCENPLPEVRYTESAAELGLASHSTNPDWTEGGSAAVEDFDSDGDLDIILSYLESSPVYYERTSTGFTPQTLDGMRGPYLLTLADVDGDGDSDVLGGQFSPPATLLINENGVFDSHALPNLELGPGSFVKELTPGDINGDGHLDLYGVSSGRDELSPANRADFVLLGEGGAEFRSAQILEPPEVSGRLGFDGLLFDWQNDGDLDAYVVNDKGSEFGGNVFWVNESGTLELSDSQCFCDIVHDGMGADVGDFDQNGIADLLLVGATSIDLLAGQADHSFVNMTDALLTDPVVTSGAMGWAGIFLDHDNDGWQDLLITQGTRTPDSPIPFDKPGPASLLRQSDGVFTDVSSALGLPTDSATRSVVASDHNQDGVLDLLITHVEDRPFLFLSDGCTSSAWLEVAAPSGSRVVVETNGSTQTDWVSSESGYGGASALSVHFGLGDAEEVTALSITLLDGTVYRSNEPFTPRRTVSVP